MANLLTLTESCQYLKNKDVIAYPTEAVFGLGCDPDCESAVLTILALKKRPISKGLILIASSYQQLLPYIDESQITEKEKQQIITPAKTPTTWIVPKNRHTAYFLTGDFDSIAIRITKHDLVCKLCDLFGKPLVSTSANLSGQEPCKTIAEVAMQFGEDFPILNGEIGKQQKPSAIKDIKSGKIIRQG